MTLNPLDLDISRGGIMLPPPKISMLTYLSRFPEEARLELLSALGEGDIDAIQGDWLLNARREQLPPPGDDWRIWLILGGRGFGKTRTGAEYLYRKHRYWGVQCSALVGPTTGDIRKYMIEGESGVLQITPEEWRPEYFSSKREIEWPNGTITHCYTAEEPERIRGPNLDFAWCLAKGTLIQTLRGSIPIDKITVSDYIMTRQGARSVLASSLTGKNKPVLEVKTADGHSVRATANHSFWVMGKGWTRCDQLATGDKLWTYSKQDRPHGLNGTVTSGTGSSQDIIKTEQECCSMLQSGKRQTSKNSLKAMSFITRMQTAVITILKTWNVCLREIMSGCIWQSEAQTIPGMTGHHPLARRPRGHFGERKNLWSGFVKSVNKNIRQKAPIHDSVALPAETSSAIVSVEPSGMVDVYDLTVESAHEFFADGVLVHNCDELASWAEHSEEALEYAWQMLRFCMRTGTPETVITMTPKPRPLLNKLIKRRDIVITGGSTYENEANLASEFLEEMRDDFEGTTIGRQELYAQILDMSTGGLWNPKQLEAIVVDADEVPELVRIIIAVDPATTAKEGSDYTAIIVVGLGTDGLAYVLADYTLKASPLGWANKVKWAYQEWKANLIVVEVNQGGDLVTSNLHQVDRMLPIKSLHVYKGKITRAEPIAAKYEQGLVRHVRNLLDLEQQMCMMKPGRIKKSPDRADALVYALTELIGGFKSRAGVWGGARKKSKLGS